MRAAPPCQMKPLKARMYARNWGDHITLHLGCVSKPNTDVTPANPDLRDMVLPPNYDAQEQLVIQGGNTEYLPRLPLRLRRLTLSKNQLRELPALPATITMLDIDHNNLTQIPRLPPNLLDFDIRHNSIRVIPGPLPETLTRFYITHNQVTELPTLENTVVNSVGLGFNSLTVLPKFPETLVRLGCQNNQITEISGLPARLQVLSCSNNPLEVLNVQNLRFLHTLVASNCGLRQIPILPVPHDAGDDDDGDNNNDNDGGWRRRQHYIFTDNPLEPEFQEVYDEYQEDENAKRFRKAVLSIYRSRIAKKKETLGALISTFKGPSAAVPTDAAAAAAGNNAARTAATLAELGANNGPMNLIASFITGKPGTIESQRLALVENQERLGAVPEGTAQRMREHIAEVAEGEVAHTIRLMDSPEELNRIQKRAKLYVNKKNLNEAAKRLGARDADAAEILEQTQDSNSNDNNGGNNNGNNNGNRMVRVVNNDEENGEAMRVAMAEARREAEAEEEEENEEEERPNNEAEVEALLEELRPVMAPLNLPEAEQRRRARMALNIRRQQGQGGRRVTPRKKKSSKRHTRKH